MTQTLSLNLTLTLTNPLTLNRIKPYNSQPYTVIITEYSVSSRWLSQPFLFVPLFTSFNCVASKEVRYSRTIKGKINKGLGILTKLRQLPNHILVNLHTLVHPYYTTIVILSGLLVLVPT